VLQKDNVGDGTLYGFEARGELDLDEEWVGFAVASWQSGEVDQFTAGGNKVSKPTSRVMPFTGVVGATYRPIDADWWITGDTFFAAKADQLSLKDETDTQRIPPGGTPGYGILGIRGGRPLTPDTTLTVGLENILDEDYRIHGSGVNEPGRSLVVGLEVRF
jgi:hemoglobin/transferrin/lactoferrin receptor protein